jgi:hypothetical protein
VCGRPATDAAATRGELSCPAYCNCSVCAFASSEKPRRMTDCLVHCTVTADAGCDPVKHCPFLLAVAMSCRNPTPCVCMPPCANRTHVTTGGGMPRCTCGRGPPHVHPWVRQCGFVSPMHRWLSRDICRVSALVSATCASFRAQVSSKPVLARCSSIRRSPGKCAGLGRITLDCSSLRTPIYPTCSAPACSLTPTRNVCRPALQR